MRQSPSARDLEACQLSERREAQLFTVAEENVGISYQRLQPLQFGDGHRIDIHCPARRIDGQCRQVLQLPQDIRHGIEGFLSVDFDGERLQTFHRSKTRYQAFRNVVGLVERQFKVLEMSKLGEVGDQMRLQDVWCRGVILKGQRGDGRECLGDALHLVHVHLFKLDRQFPRGFVPTTTDQTAFANVFVQNAREDLQQEVLFFEQCAQEAALGQCRLHVTDYSAFIDATGDVARLRNTGGDGRESEEESVKKVACGSRRLLTVCMPYARSICLRRACVSISQFFFAFRLAVGILHLALSTAPRCLA